MLNVTREAFRKYLVNRDKPWKYEAVADEIRRILKEERVALMTAYQLMHFLVDQEPFGFLKGNE